MSPAPQRTTERARRPKHLVVGRVIRPHGVRGALLVEPLSDVLESISSETPLYLGTRRRPAHVVSLQRQGRQFRLQLEGCSDRDQAERFRGDAVQVRLDAAPALAPGRYYHWQILGMRVRSEAGETVGVLRQILETGANDVYLLETESGDEILLPAITSVIRRVDLEEGVMTVRMLPGLAETTRRKAAQ